jgi:CRISPR/Cas system-associated exonuclease Cas4 (RecB family)
MSMFDDPAEVFRVAKKKLEEEMSASSMDRDEEAEKKFDEEGTVLVHASELGRCPVYLHAKYSGKANNRSFSNKVFLHDGFVHEDDTAAMIVKILPEDMILRRGTSIRVELAPNILLVGTLDIEGVNDAGEVPWVIEHKAVKHDTFISYEDAPSTIPVWYHVQLAIYMVDRNAESGLLLIKDRNEGNFLHVQMTRERAEALYKEYTERVVKIIEGKYDLMHQETTYECSFCSMARSCFGKAVTGETKKGKEIIAGQAAPDPKHAVLLSDVDRLWGIHEELNRLTAEKDVLRTAIQAVMESVGVVKVEGVLGKASYVTSKGRTYPNREDVKRLTDEGKIRTETSEPSLYLRVSKAGK